MMKMILIFIIMIESLLCFNSSLCGQFQMQGVYFFLNQNSTDQNTFMEISFKNQTQISIVYNYCKKIEYYCEQKFQIVVGSLINIQQCTSFNQKEIKLLTNNLIDSGIKVTYVNDNDTIELIFPCSLNSLGCPNVTKSIIFDYFQSNQLGIIIAVEILGILLMVLGIYIYRVTAVFIGATSIFFILIGIQSNIIFLPGFSEIIITNTLIITGICSFSIGYLVGYFPKVGIFFIGSWIGLILSLTLNNVAFYFIISEPANLTLWIVMPILVLGFGILAICIKKTFLVFATSFIGAYLCLRALSWELGAFPNEFLYPLYYQLNLKQTIQWEFYLYILALLILTGSSTALQYWLFRKKLKKQKNYDNIQGHFQIMEKQMKNKRENIVQFNNIFERQTNSQQIKRPLMIPKKQKMSQKQQSDEEGSNGLLDRLVIKKNQQE